MKILIAGDSWGCGEWSDEFLPLNFSPIHHGLNHNGLEQYLRDENFIVKNLSEPGCSHQIMYRRLYFELKYNPNYWDKIIVFQTTPTRDFKWDSLPKKQSYDDLIVKCNDYLDKFYIALNGLNCPVNLLGGCSKVNINLIDKYENLQSCIPSILEFLIPEFQQPKLWTDILKLVEQMEFTLNDTDKIVNETEILFNLAKLSHHFIKAPYHPDRNAHKKIFNFLKLNYLKQNKVEK